MVSNALCMLRIIAFFITVFICFFLMRVTVLSKTVVTLIINLMTLFNFSLNVDEKFDKTSYCFIIFAAIYSVELSPILALFP